MSKNREWFENRSTASFLGLWKRWRSRWRSGVVRAVEKALAGAAFGDLVSTSLHQFEHLPEISKQVLDLRLTGDPEHLPGVRRPGDARIRDEVVEKVRVREIDFADAIVHTNLPLVGLASGHLFTSDHFVGGLLALPGGASHELWDMQHVRTSLSGTYFILRGTPYYYHHVVDNVIPFLRVLESTPEAVALAPEGQALWFYEMLDVLEIRYRITSDRAVRLEKVVWRDPTIVGWADISALRKRLPEERSSPLDGSDRIVLSRKGLDRYSEATENTLLAWTNRFGLERVEPGELSVSRQMDKFSAARLIIGPHGGSMTNMLWARKGCTVIEIFGAYRGYQFARLARACGHSYLPLAETELKDRLRLVEVENAVSALD